MGDCWIFLLLKIWIFLVFLLDSVKVFAFLEPNSFKITHKNILSSSQEKALEQAFVLYKPKNAQYLDDEDKNDINTDSNQVEIRPTSITPVLKDRLLAEARAPFRKLRLFIYGAFALGAGIGGFTAVTQLFSALNGNENGPGIEQSLQNVFIDFAVVTASVFGFIFETNAQSKLEQESVEQSSKRKFKKISEETAKERLLRLQNLFISVQNPNEDGKFPLFKVSEINNGAEQHVVVIGGTESMIKDCLLQALLIKDQFLKAQTLLVPVKIRSEFSSSAAKGFSMSPEYMTKPYVAPPFGLEDWQNLIEDEIKDASLQGVEKVRKQGIVLVLRNDGKLIRRGIGIPQWSQLLDELEKRK